MVYYKVPRGRIQISKESLIDDIRRVAKVLSVESLSTLVYSKHGKFSCGAVSKTFGSWNNAIKVAELVPNPQHRKKFKHEFTRHTMAEGRKLAVLKRDHFMCCLCGANPPADHSVELQIDHIYPVSLGGSSKLHNLWTLCSKCNNKKRDIYNEKIEGLAQLHRIKCHKEMLIRSLQKVKSTN